MRRKDSKPKSPTESAYARQIRLWVERVAYCTDVYNAAFRDAVAQAWRMYQNGGPIVRRGCGLQPLLKEARTMAALAMKSLRGGVLVGEFPCPWPLQSVGSESMVTETGAQPAPRGYPPCRICGEAGKGEHTASCAFSGKVEHEHIMDYAWGCTCENCGLDGCNDCPTHKGVCWTQPEAQESAELVDLRARLARLERLPENEGVAFQLESEIYKLENAAPALGSEEWPDVIGGDDEPSERSAKQPWEKKWKNALVRIKGAPQLGLIKLIASVEDGYLPPLSVLFSQEPIPLSAFELVENGEAE